MDRTNKIKAKVALFCVFNAFCSGIFADHAAVNIIQTEDFDNILNPDKGFMRLLRPNDNVNIKDAFVEDFLQGPNLNKKKKLVLKEKIGQGGFGAVYKAEQDGAEYIVKQAVDKDAIDDMKDEHRRTLDIFDTASRFVRTPDVKNIYGKLLGLGVIVPVIGETEDGGIVQAYANGENLRLSATCATEEGLRERINDELQQILLNNNTTQTRAGNIAVMYDGKFWTNIKKLSKQLFDKITEPSTPDAKTFVQEYLTQAEGLANQLLDEATVTPKINSKTLIEQYRIKVKNLADNLLYKVVQKPIIDMKAFFGKYLPGNKQVQTLTDYENFSTDCHKIEALVINLRQNRRTDFFNEHGFPWNPQKALRVLCSFFYALLTLHELGYVHCDLKPDNVILTHGKIGFEDNTVLKLIDFGGLTPIGERIGIYSSNGAPESLNPQGIYNHQVLSAQPSYDIYCSVGIILGCLFGYSGLQTDYANFWPTATSESSIYVQHLKNPAFRNEIDGRRFKFFRKMLQNLNSNMGRYGDNYPDSVLNIITTILYWMTEPDWQLRPSAIDILERLQELALSDWSSKNFQIQVPQNQAFQEDNQMPFLQPQEKSEKSFLKRIFTAHRRG